MVTSPFNIIGDGEVSVRAHPIDAKEVVRSSASNEFVFAVVGHVGSGTSLIAEALQEALADERLPGATFETRIIKARSVLTEWAVRNDFPLRPPDDKSMQATELLQDCGDAMRKRVVGSGQHDYAAVAKGLIKIIHNLRAAAAPKTDANDGTIALAASPKRKAYILDALRHPAEVDLLRRIYLDAFVLIGVACEEEVRSKRLRDKFPDAGKDKTSEFMKRDAKAEEKYGQRVADTFHLADYFLDNTISRTSGSASNPSWDVLEKLGRLVKIITHAEVIRPEVEETAMHHAHAAMMQSACLSRQVGAALMDADGALIATGTNEVPKGGGGVYGEPVKGPTARFTSDSLHESRCALRGQPNERYCSNTREQNDLIDELINATEGGTHKSDEQRQTLAKRFRETRVGGLLEFSRAVHAEMDALLTAGRTGSSTIGTRLFVTTFPCHYCARHIVSAGVDEVQYIEPYPKSLALKLHNDSICVVVEGWQAPSKNGRTVLFRPFSGVAPRYYRRAFLKDRELKDSSSGRYTIGEPEWGNPYYLSKIGYLQMEAELLKDE